MGEGKQMEPAPSQWTHIKLYLEVHSLEKWGVDLYIWAFGSESSKTMMIVSI